MLRTEHIITVVAEEGGEVAKEACKALRFGLKDKVTMNPLGPRGETGPDNSEKLRDELVDLLGAYQKGVREGIFHDIGLDQLPEVVVAAMDRKGDRMEAYMGYAIRVGALEGELSPCHLCIDWSHCWAQQRCHKMNPAPAATDEH